MRMLFPLRTLAIAASAILQLTGCSTMGLGQNDFNCGTHDNPKCASVMEAYENSHGTAEKGGRKGQKKELRAENLPGAAPVQMTASVDDASYPKPILEPAKVMRIWVAPWVDEKETLHWPSYVFTEIATRKWSYGQPDFRGVKQLVPIQAERRVVGAADAKKSN